MMCATMGLSKKQPYPFSFFLIIIYTTNYMVTSDESCYQYRRKANVTIDTDQCLWENYTEPRLKRICLEVCFENATCTGVAMINEPAIQQCCFLYQKNIHYRQPGDSILYHRKDAELQCKKHWTGRNCDSCALNFDLKEECSRCRTGWSGNNCDSCAPNFEPPGNCSKCSTGWTGDNCDSCAPNFEPPGNCSKCITGWVGNNCDACAPNFEPPGNCSRCNTGWAGDKCEVCALGWLPPGCSTCQFGFSTESGCTECIQNGLWTGTVHSKDLTVRLTFTGETCSELAPGTELTVPGTTVTVCEGNVDAPNNVLRFTESNNWVYEGTTNKDKSVNGTATKGQEVQELSMSFNPAADN